MTARLIAAFALALLLAQAAAADPKADWPLCKNFAATLEAARQQGTPISIAYIDVDNTPNISIKDTLEWLQTRVPSKDTLRIRVYTSSRDAAFKALAQNLACPTGAAVIICDGRGCVLGLWYRERVQNPSALGEADHRLPADMVATAWTVVKWEKSVDDQLKTVEASLKQRQYAEVSKLIARIADQDKKYTDQLAAAVPWQPADKRDPWFYEKEVKAARAKLKDAVQKELDADQALLAAGKLKETQDALKIILDFKDDAELAKKIADLSAQLIQALKAARANAISAASATPAAAAK